MKKPRTIVSDHALVRFLERVRGMDVEVIRAEIGHNLDRALDRADEVQPMPMASGVMLDGFSYRLTNGRVTTVRSPGSPDPRTGGARRELADDD